METPPDPESNLSQNPNDDVLSADCTPETATPVTETYTPSENHLNDRSITPENDLRQSSETQSLVFNAAVEGSISDSLDDSSGPIPDEPHGQQLTNANSKDQAQLLTKRHRRKRVLTDANSNQSFWHNRIVSDLSKEINGTDELIAISVGFPVDSLTEEEIEANVVQVIGGSEQRGYIIARNYILARWRSNVSVWLTRDAVLQTIPCDEKQFVDAAYEFLLEHGYVNFGLAPAIKEEQLMKRATTERANVIVVGAGLAGLVAARQLMALGFKVVVLEGRNRPGGRVKMKVMKGSGVIAAADLGGSVITGINGNPLGVLARQLGLPLHRIRDNCPLYLPSGKLVDPDVDNKIEVAFNELLDKVYKLREAMKEEVKSVDVNLGAALEAFRHAYHIANDPEEQMLLNWHFANLEYANASLLSNLSMAYWDQDDPYEMCGDHCFAGGGSYAIVRELAKDVPIFYETVVVGIKYGVDGVVVCAKGQEFYGDMVLCTVPLGVLKRGSIAFIPELPDRKKEAIRKLGYGLLNKVLLLFPNNFWGEEVDTFGHLTEDSSMRGDYFLFYSYSAVSGGPLLIALVAGDAAVKLEKTSPMESVRRVLDILRGIFHPQGIVVPDPVQAVCTCWGKDWFSHGSYSYVSVGSSGDDYDTLAESVGDGRVFFAGEATNRQHPASMHGALLSGMREAAKILRTSKARAFSPTNRFHSETEAEHDDSFDKLFDKPDLAFRNFSFLFDPRSDHLQSLSLLRLKFKRKRLDSSCLCLYGLVSRNQALRLSETADCRRMDMLRHELGIKLVGRKGITEEDEGESLVLRLKAAKKLP